MVLFVFKGLFSENDQLSRFHSFGIMGRLFGNFLFLLTCMLTAFENMLGNTNNFFFGQKLRRMHGFASKVPEGAGGMRNAIVRHVFILMV